MKIELWNAGRYNMDKNKLENLISNIGWNNVSIGDNLEVDSNIYIVSDKIFKDKDIVEFTIKDKDYE